MTKIAFRKTESPRLWDVLADGKKVGEFYYERTREIVRNKAGSRILNVRTYGRIWNMDREAEDISFCSTFLEARRWAVYRFSKAAEEGSREAVEAELQGLEAKLRKIEEAGPGAAMLATATASKIRAVKRKLAAFS